MKKNIIILLIVLSGIFYYKTILPGSFEQSQFGFFIFYGGILCSLLIYKENKWLGAMAGLCSLMFLKSYLFLLGPREALYKTSLIGIFIFGSYYAAKKLDLKKDILKWFLVPIILNIIVVLMQAFDHTAYFLNVSDISGFLGMTGKIGCYLILATPLFLEYVPILLPVLLIIVLLCKSSLVFIGFSITTFVWLFLKKKKPYYSILLALVLLDIACVIFFTHIPWNRGDIPQRICYWIGTLDGIRHNPIFGWGIGNFETIWSDILQADTNYFTGYACNYTATPMTTKIMNHPHNEVLLWWWFMGVGMPILFLGLCFDVVRKFKEENILPFSILVGGFTVVMLYFLSLPAWIFLMITLAVYEKEALNGKEKS